MINVKKDVLDELYREAEVNFSGIWEVEKAIDLTIEKCEKKCDCGDSTPNKPKCDTCRMLFEDKIRDQGFQAGEGLNDLERERERETGKQETLRKFEEFFHGLKVPENIDQKPMPVHFNETIEFIKNRLLKKLEEEEI